MEQAAFFYRGVYEEMGAFTVVLVLLLAGIGFAVGWFARTIVSSRRSARAGGALSAAAADAASRAYDDGFRAGYNRAGYNSAGVNSPAPLGVNASPVTATAPVGPPVPFSPPVPFNPPVTFNPQVPPGTPAPLSYPEASGHPAPVGPPVPSGTPAPVHSPQRQGPPLPPPSTPRLPGPAGDAAWFARNSGQPGPDLQPAGPGPVQPPSAEEQAKRAAGDEARRRRRDLRNINITLYAACLLLVAAASLFIGLAIPEGARFAGVSMVTGLFYAGGLVVHARSRRLRPAAVAFTGTGLALIPVVGLALHNLVLRDAPLSWLVTSVVGTAAFAFAAARLESRVVAYLSMTFLLSTALASGASMRAGIIWYFLFTVLLATAVSLVAMRRPAWLGNIYAAAFVRSHRFLVPAAAGVALLTAVELGGWQFSLLFLAFSCYYAVLFLQSRHREKLYSSYGFRATATIGFAVLASKATDDAAAGILAASLLLLVQAAGLLVLRRRYSALGGHQFFVTDYVLVIVLQILAGLAAGQFAAGIMPGGSASPVLFTGTAAAVLLTCIAGAWRITSIPDVVPACAVLLGFAAWLNGGAGTLWPEVLLLVVLACHFILRAATSTGPAREDYWLWARATAVILVAVASMAALDTAGAGARETLVWSLSTTAAAVIINQCVSVCLLIRGATDGAAPFARPSSTRPSSTRLEVPVAAAAAGVTALLALFLRLTESPDAVVTLWVLFSALLANVATSLLLRRFFEERSWLEGIGPAGFAAAALVGAGVLGVRGYEVLTVAALVYCGFMAARGARAGRRGVYLLAGQILLTVLVALVAADLDLSVHDLFVATALSVLLQQVLRTLLQDRFAGAGVGRLAAAAQWGSAGVLVFLPLAYEVLAFEPLASTTSVLLVTAAASALFIQLSVVVRRSAGVRVPYPGGSLAGAAALAALLTLWLRLAEAPDTELTMWVLFLSLAVNVLTSLAQRPLFPEVSRLEWAGPAGFAAAGLLGTGLLGLRGYEVLTVAALGYCLFMVVRGGRAGRRGSYLLAGQVLLTVLTALVAMDLDWNIHAAFTAVLVSVAAQQVLRTLLGRVYHAAPLRELGNAALWGSVAALTLLPLVYAAAADGDVRRHVVVTSLSLLLAMTAAAGVAERNTTLLLPALYSLGMLPLVLTRVMGFESAGVTGDGSAPPAPLSLAGAWLLYLILAAALLALETSRAIGATVRTRLLAGGALYCIPALALAGAEGSALLMGLTVLLPAAGFLTVSFTRRLPWLTVVTVALVPVAAFLIQSWVVRDVLTTAAHGGAARLWSGFAAALLLYASGYVLSVLPSTATMMLRRRILGSGAAVIAAGAGVSVMPYHHISGVYGSVVLVAALAAAVREVPPAWREAAGEAAALVAALSAQRIILYTLDGAGWFWVLQYWVLVLAALAAYEYRRGRAQWGNVVLSVSAGLLSATGLGTIVTADATEQVWALLAHSGLLAFGVVANRRLFTVWGAAGVALAVLWYLRGYTFLLLALLAAALIALAVWRLSRVRPDTVPKAER